MLRFRFGCHDISIPHRFIVLVFYILSSLVLLSDSDSVSNEELYNQHFPLDPVEYQNWPYAQKWSQEPSERDHLKRFCGLAHRRSGRGPCHVNLVLYKMRYLSFVNDTFPRRHIDLLEYGCREGAEPADISTHWLVAVDDRWYITQGTKWDCVFYLTRVNASVEYIIDEHVCGIKIYEISYTLVTPPANVSEIV